MTEKLKHSHMKSKSKQIQFIVQLLTHTVQLDTLKTMRQQMQLTWQTLTTSENHSQVL